MGRNAHRAGWLNWATPATTPTSAETQLMTRMPGVTMMFVGKREMLGFVCQGTPTEASTKKSTSPARAGMGPRISAATKAASASLRKTSPPVRWNQR